MMAINRYRLKHLVNQKDKGAKRVSKLLRRTDKLLGVILIGNNFVNILASALTTLIAMRLWGDTGIIYTTIALTFIILIFAEVTPKTIAALKPDSIAFPASYILKPLLKILYPLVSIIGSISNGITKILGVNPEEEIIEELSPEELKSILQSSGVPEKQQLMLMGIFDMDYLSVKDVMIPKNEIQGINLNDNLDNIIDKLQTLNFTHIPCYKDSIDNILGFLDINTKAEFISEGVQNINFLKKNLEAPLFILENTTLSKQLGNFQKETRRVGLIVDEYGDVQGLITLRDLIEEIVGKITADSIDKMDIMPQADGSFMLEGSMMIREINKRMNWDLPTDGPKTLSGLILETAQSIPEKNVGISMGAYRFETVLIKDNVVKLARAEKLQLSEEE
tara:strand:+ start:668 stop:1843 length:1176 start_codon:yes stop_codon:yes gene_type:complete